MENQSNLIFKKIPAIMAKVGVVGKDRKNEKQGYRFRGIDDMYNALNRHLSEEEVFVTSSILDVKREERQSQSGGLLLYSTLTMSFKFFASDGSSVESITIGEAMDSGDKSMNKAMSVAYKYALMQIFCIPTEEEKDSENQTYEVGGTTTPQTPIAHQEGVVKRQESTQTDEDGKLINDALKINPNDAFVLSLQSGYKKYGKLTDKQRTALSNLVLDFGHEQN